MLGATLPPSSVIELTVIVRVLEAAAPLVSKYSMPFSKASASLIEKPSVSEIVRLSPSRSLEICATTLDETELVPLRSATRVPEIFRDSVPPIASPSRRITIDVIF